MSRTGPWEARVWAVSIPIACRYEAARRVLERVVAILESDDRGFRRSACARSPAFLTWVGCVASSPSSSC